MKSMENFEAAVADEFYHSFLKDTVIKLAKAISTLLNLLISQEFFQNSCKFVKLKIILKKV